MAERNLVAISIKHTEWRWKFGMPCWLWVNHRDIFAMNLFGHTELITEEMWQEYIDWCQTEDGRQYLKGGSKYEEADGNG